MKRVIALSGLCLILLVVISACHWDEKKATKEWPKENYWGRSPEEPFNSSDYAFKLTQMESFYTAPGEFGHLLEGEKYGFESFSFIISETHPGGGPPLHTHESEEAHVLLEGKASYVIGDNQFTVEGPYVAKVPAGVPHTFINAGNSIFRLVAVFPDKSFTYKEVGKNPLVK